MLCGNKLTLVTFTRQLLMSAPLLVLALLTGCGSDLAEVHGTVTLDGQNIAAGPNMHGTVLFSPTLQGGASGTGVLDPSGRYTVFVGGTEGLRPGPYQVAIAVTRILPPKTEGAAPGGQLITPREYASPKDSGLTADVKPGTNTFDFALSSRRSN